ncbi:MAG: hypothetical protein KGQ49_04315 [Verrucomicrobia bacterium]|nr:hypothetical protein [Verrucomicrobiota bacterium]MBU6446602.1 hypothetical protein [Verrucomicrobiota bacterium]MDE3047081.1 hypothetical protein [Verrucomicrobiota bacterium]
MTDLELLQLDHMGFIPGPEEQEEPFLARVQTTQAQYAQADKIPEAHWDWVREFLDHLFHVKPLYICAFYSNRGLTPWQGGASWIEGRKLKAVQLREALKKGHFLWLYRREEILAHEAVHGVRCGFNEDRSEEFFAYMTSEKKWRRVLGPILQRPWEAWPFLLCALGGIFWAPFYLGGAIWSSLGFIRLIRQHRRFKRASDQIQRVTRNARSTRAVLFRLTDEEIEQFSKNVSIDLFAAQQTCLRWRVIRHYLKGELWPKKSL